jgi:hypothetical protein
VIGPRLCECGCGQPTPIAKRTDHKRGLVAGEPVRFIRGHAGSARAQELRAARTGTTPRARFSTPTERYLEELLRRSKLIVEAVRDTGPDELLREIDLALALEQPPGVDPAVALVTVLAAQIDPKATDEQRLGWVRQFDPMTAAPRPGSLPVRASPRKENAA